MRGVPARWGDRLVAFSNCGRFGRGNATSRVPPTSRDPLPLLIPNFSSAFSPAKPPTGTAKVEMVGGLRTVFFCQTGPEKVFSANPVLLLPPFYGDDKCHKSKLNREILPTGPQGNLSC